MVKISRVQLFHFINHLKNNVADRLCVTCSGSLKSSVSNCVASHCIYIMSHHLISKLVYKFNKVLWAPHRWIIGEWRSWDQQSVVEWISVVSIKQRPGDWTRKHKRAGTFADSGDCLMHHPHLPRTELCGSRSEPFCLGTCSSIKRSVSGLQ